MTRTIDRTTDHTTATGFSTRAIHHGYNPADHQEIGRAHV